MNVWRSVVRWWRARRDEKLRQLAREKRFIDNVRWLREHRSRERAR